MEPSELGHSNAQSGSDGKKLREFSIKIPKRNTLLVVLSLIIIMSLSFQIRMSGFHNPDGTPKWPYLRNVDSYSYFGEVERMLDGSGIYVIGGRLYQHVTVLSYRLFVGSDVTMESLTQFLIWWPAFLISLAAIPAYFAGRYLYDRKAGVLAAFFLVMSPNIATRSLAGDPDSDAFIILIMMLSVALFVVSVRKFDSSKLFGKGNIFYSVLAGLGIAIFALTWPGYWFVFLIIFGAITGKIAVTSIRSRLEKKTSGEIINSAKPLLFNLILIFVGFWIITIPLLGPQYIYDPFAQVGVSANLFGSGGIKSEAGCFPNVYVSVAELQQGGQTGNIINRASAVDLAAGASQIDPGLLGMISPFVLSMFAIAYLIYSYYRRNEHLDTLLVIGLWVIGMLYSSITAVRFEIFLAPAFIIASSIGISKLWNILFQHEKVSV